MHRQPCSLLTFCSFIILLAAGSCKSKHSNYSEAAGSGNAIQIPVSTSGTTLYIDDSLYHFSVTRLDSTQLVAEASKFLKAPGGFYLLDKKSNGIFRFNDDGSLRWKYSKVGRGPQEHDKLSDFSVRGNKVYLLDKINRVLVLDTNGQFMFKKTLPYQKLGFFTHYFFVNEHNDLVTYNFDGGHPDEPVGHKVIVLDSSMQNIKKVYLKKTNAKGDKRWTPSRFPLQHFASNTGFYYTEALNDTIYAYSGDSLERRYVVNFGKNTAPASFKAKSSLTLHDFWTSKYGGNITYLVDADSILAFRTQIAGDPFFHFYNKQSGKVASFRILLLKSGEYHAAINFMGGDGNRLYFLIEPVEVLEAYKYLRKVKFKTLSDAEFKEMIRKRAPLFNSLLNGLNMYSNQILLSIEIPVNHIFKQS